MVKIILLCLGLWSAGVFAVEPVVPAAPNIDTHTPDTPLEKKELLFKNNSSFSFSIIIKMIVVSLLLLGAAYGLLYAIKRYGYGTPLLTGNSSQRIKLLEIKRLSPKSSIILVQIDDYTFAIAQYQDQLIQLDQQRHL